MATHLPWFVPKEVMDMIPDDFELPPYPPNDLDDIPDFILKKAQTKEIWFQQLTAKKLWRETFQHYLACIKIVDLQLGRLMDFVMRES